MKYSTIKRKLKNRAYVEKLYTKYSVLHKHLKEYGLYELTFEDYKQMTAFTERKMRQLKKVLDDMK